MLLLSIFKKQNLSILVSWTNHSQVSSEEKGKICYLQDSTCFSKGNERVGQVARFVGYGVILTIVFLS